MDLPWGKRHKYGARYHPAPGVLFLTELLVALLQRRSSFGSFSLSRRIASVFHAVCERAMTAYLEVMVIVSKNRNSPCYWLSWINIGPILNEWCLCLEFVEEVLFGSAYSATALRLRCSKALSSFKYCSRWIKFPTVSRFCATYRSILGRYSVDTQSIIRDDSVDVVPLRL